MKTKVFISMMIMFSILSLSGCTMLLWGHDSPMSTTYHYQDAGTDKVHAFGITKQQTTQLQKDQLIMMGEQYWYALTPKSSEDLLAVMNAKLAQRYRIFNGDNQQELSAMPVELRDEGKHFASHFCLRYQPKNAQEKATIEQLSFKALEKQRQIYTRCFYSYGDIYATPANVKADYQFEQTVPVKLTLRHSKTKIEDAGKFAAYVLWTPITLAADIAGAVIVLPFMAIQKIAGQ